MISQQRKENMFNLHEFENDDENQIQIKLSSTIVQISTINLLKFSTFAQCNYLYTNIKEIFSQQLMSHIKKYKISDKSIQIFAQILNGEDFQISNDVFCDLSKLSSLFQINSLQKCLKKYIQVHSEDIDFNISMIRERNSINDDVFEHDDFSQKAEDFLCYNIDKCFENEQFGKLPISTIYRIFTKSDTLKIDSDQLCLFIMKSIEERHVLFSFIKLQNLSDNVFCKLYENFSKGDEVAKYYSYLPFDLTYIKTLKELKQKLEKEINDLNSNQIILNEQQIQISNDKIKLESEIKEITKEKNELQLQLDKNIKEKQDIEELLDKIKEEKEIIFKNHQNLSKENEIMNEKNRILEDENNLFHEKEKNIYYEMVDTLFLNNADVNKFNISGISIKYIYKPVLHFLCELGNVDLVKYFISIKEVNINLLWNDEWDISLFFQKTALNVAIENNHNEVVKVLLTHPNIDVNIKSSLIEN